MAVPRSLLWIVQVVASMVPSDSPEAHDPDLARLNAACETLPTHIKAAILALLDTANSTAQRGTINV